MITTMTAPCVRFKIVLQGVFKFKKKPHQNEELENEKLYSMFS